MSGKILADLKFDIAGFFQTIVEMQITLCWRSSRSTSQGCDREEVIRNGQDAKDYYSFDRGSLHLKVNKASIIRVTRPRPDQNHQDEEVFGSIQEAWSLDSDSN